MKKGFIAIILVLMIAGAELSAYYLINLINPTQGNQSFTRKIPHVGVTYGGNTTQEGKLLVDKVKEYTSLFVIDSTAVARNRTALTDLCDYVINSGLHVMVYFSYIIPSRGWIRSWLEAARERWGDKFAGIYLYDEPGGKQLDCGNWAGDWAKPMNASSYSEAARQYVENVSAMWGMDTLKLFGIPIFTADFGLYWFDYLAGYDCVFAEFGWNHSRPLHVALVRGAAKVQQKQWGVIITWEYNDPPYIENGVRLLEDMMYAYNAEADYILVFNYPQNMSQYGILKDEHFDAMKQFWGKIHEKPNNPNTGKIRAAFVLPPDYGWAMMSPNDRIWGIFPIDSTAQHICEQTQALFSQNVDLDIVYDDPRFNLERKWAQIYFCDD